MKMNNLDKQYTDLLQDILDNGVRKEDRTGTGTLSVFGRQIRHKMSDGFPLLTTKKMPFKTITTELLWFLRGDTNIKYLVDNNCHIWDGDAYKNFVTTVEENRPEGYTREVLTQEEFIAEFKHNDEFAKKWGSLGKIYGFQWRNWGGEFSLHIGLERDGSQDKINFKKGIDQIANLINDLKTNPDSRRLMVNAWNPADLDASVLPPCHYGFQVYTRELSERERIEMIQPFGMDALVPEVREKWMKENNIPTRAISLQWNQRSVDTFLGLPFNIASYGLLLEIIAKEVNMVPDELIGNLGDTHLYLNHIEQAKEQIGRELTIEERGSLYRKQQNLSDDVSLIGTDRDAHRVFDDYGITKRTREPYPLPKLTIDQFDETNHYIGDMDDISEYNIEQFKLENYQSHPTIKAPLSN